MNSSEMFIEGLKNNNKELLAKVPKIDIHNHAVYSCKKTYLIKNNIQLPEHKICDIASLNEFSKNYINSIQYTEEGLKLLLKGDFDNCIKTGVKVVSPSVDYKACIRIFDSNIEEFISFLQTFRYDNLKILWDLGISRDSYKDEHSEVIEKLIKTKIFTGIDLYATENSVPNYKFIKFYEMANNLGLITKVHAGEQLGAEYVKECIMDFNPKQIQHGIHIVEDINVMKLAKERGIVFNVCPTSNIVLGYAKSITEHPIKIMGDFGLNVTIGTDDLLFFDSDINEEYLKLYNEKVLSAEQLNNIRIYGLELVKAYCLRFEQLHMY